jgi:hypothetical protein
MFWLCQFTLSWTKNNTPGRCQMTSDDFRMLTLNINEKNNVLGLTFDDVNSRYTRWTNLRGEDLTGSRFLVSFNFFLS